MNQVKFNNDFSSNEADELKNNNKAIDLEIDQDIITNQILPHKQPVEDIIIGIRDLFFIILDKLEVICIYLKRRVSMNESVL